MIPETPRPRTGPHPGVNSEHWSVLEIVLGTSLLARVCGPFDDEHNAARLEYLTDLVARLRRSYDTLGIQQWFMQQSEAVSATPVDVLQGDWNPNDAGPRLLQEGLPPARG